MRQQKNSCLLHYTKMAILTQTKGPSNALPYLPVVSNSKYVGKNKDQTYCDASSEALSII